MTELLQAELRTGVSLAGQVTVQFAAHGVVCRNRICPYH